MKVYRNCWIWRGALSPKGYGRSTSYVRGTLRMHRIMWLLQKGRVSKGMCVLHKCDKPACINVKHLFLGTNKDNNIDAWKKGRHNFQRHPNLINRKRDIKQRFCK